MCDIFGYSSYKMKTKCVSPLSVQSSISYCSSLTLQKNIGNVFTAFMSKGWNKFDAVVVPLGGSHDIPDWACAQTETSCRIDFIHFILGYSISISFHRVHRNSLLWTQKCKNKTDHENLMLTPNCLFVGKGRFEHVSAFCVSPKPISPFYAVVLGNIRNSRKAENCE